MNIQSLLKSFTEKGILIWIDQEKVKYRAPKGIMKPSDIQTLKDNKNEIITYLNSKTKLKHDEKNRYKDFDLSDMQKAYAIGRQPQQELGGLGCKSYTEIKMPLLSPEKFERSWHKLIQNHDILQTIISDDLMHQHYEIKTYPKLKVNDYTNLGRDQKNFKYLNKRNELKRMQFSLDKFPLHHFELSMFENYTIIHFVVDMVIGDFMSVHKMIDEIIEIYNDEEIEYEELSFRDVVVFNQEKLKTTNEESLYYRDKNYWLDKIKEMPLQPELTVNPEAYNTDRPSFTRFDFKLTGEEWKKFKANCHSFNVTPSNAVLTIYKDLLQKRSLTDQFAINITLMNRYQFNEDISKVMGDFTSVNVLDTTTNKSNFKERALQIQNELLNNLDHKRFNGVEVLRELSKYHGENIIIPFVYTSTIGMPHDNNDKYEVIYGVSETPQVLIDCQVSEQNNTFTCHLDIRDNAFDTKFINAFIDEFQILLHEYAKDIKQWENESYFCSLSEKKHCKTSPPQNKNRRY